MKNDGPRAVGEAILAELDAFASALARFRAAVEASLPVPAVEGNGLDTSNDFTEDNLVSVQAASERWAIPQDTLRFWCRHEAGLGIRTGNVWRISAPALRRRLARREE